EDVEIERFYQANTDRFRAPLLYAASHILFPVAEGQSSDAALAEAISALAYLQSAPGEFANLARAHSGCPSAGVGGSLGQLSKGDLLAPVEQALLSVEPGAFYPDPVLSPFGVHVLRLDQLWPGEILPFEAVRSKIRLHLQSRAWMAAAARYTAALAQEARESGLNLMLDETGRVAPSGLTFGQWLNPDAEHERTLLNWLKAADSALFARACETAEKAGLAPIAFITQTLRTRLDAADDEAWTQIISVAQNASDPTLAALSHLLKQALTPVKRSITLIKRN
ncbi:MAG: peptidylprolyl isomerase, partial [Asticcacaulis sp.]